MSSSDQGALRVMVIDDDPLVLAVTRRVLTRAGYEVEIFEDPAHALAEIEQRAPFAVVADLNMPDLNGCELLARVKQAAPQCLRVLYTGENSVHDLEPGLAHAVLVKTGGMQSLPDALARLRAGS